MIPTCYAIQTKSGAFVGKGNDDNGPIAYVCSIPYGFLDIEEAEAVQGLYYEGWNDPDETSIVALGIIYKVQPIIPE